MCKHDTRQFSRQFKAKIFSNTWKTLLAILNTKLRSKQSHTHTHTFIQSRERVSWNEFSEMHFVRHLNEPTSINLNLRFLERLF